MPEIEQVLPSLLGELRESGLAQENDTAPDTAKRLADDLTKQVNRQPGQMDYGRRMKPITLQQPAPMQASEPSWSPTLLREKILAFYAEAGAKDSLDPGEHPGQDPGHWSTVRRTSSVSSGCSTSYPLRCGPMR